MSDSTRRTAMAERAARAGGVVARESFREAVDVETKGEAVDVVTEIDRDAQRQVVATIRQEFPEDGFLCEEIAQPVVAEDDAVAFHETMPESGDVWVVDPIDGTSNYVRGMTFWATSVAAVTDGQPVAVATYLPALQDLYAAGPESVTRNGNAISVSDRADPAGFTVGVIGAWPVETGSRYADLFRTTTDRFGDVRRLGSMQGLLAYVATGAIDAAVAPTGSPPWDTIAGVHLLRRAGGVATDIEGEPWAHDSSSLVVSNGEAHETVLETVREGTSVEVAD